MNEIDQWKGFGSEVQRSTEDHERDDEGGPRSLAVGWHG